MASEVQQMFFHVTHKKRSLEARHVILRYIYYTDHILDQIQEMLHLRREKYQENIEGMQYQRYVEGEPKLSQLMTLYAHNLSRLYAVVSKKSRHDSDVPELYCTGCLPASILIDRGIMFLVVLTSLCPRTSATR